MASPQKENGFTAIANELLEVVVRTPLAGRDKDVWLYVLRKTWGYGKKVDYISLSQFCRDTGIDHREICRILKRLVGIKMLSKNGSVYGINKDYSRWLVVPRPLGGSGEVTSGEEANRVVVTSPHTKETITKEIFTSKARGTKMKKNRLGSYSEDRASDSHEEAIDIDTGEIAQTKPKEKVSDAYWEILHWAEDRRKKKFMAITVKKQFKAFKIARESGIMPHQLKARWREFEDDEFRQKIGWDWMDVVLSFNKKPQ